MDQHYQSVQMWKLNRQKGNIFGQKKIINPLPARQ